MNPHITQVLQNDHDGEVDGTLVTSPAITITGTPTYSFISAVDDYRYRAHGDLDTLSPFTFGMFYHKVCKKDVTFGALTHHRYNFTKDHPQAKTHSVIRKINYSLPRAIHATPHNPGPLADAGLQEEYAAFILGNFTSDRSGTFHATQNECQLLIDQLRKWELSESPCDQANRQFAANMSSLNDALALGGKLAKQRREAAQRNHGTAQIHLFSNKAFHS